MKKAGKRSKKNEPKITSKAGLSGIIEKYTSLETTNNPTHTGIKSLTEITAGAGVGTVLSASLGKNSPMVGALLVLIGNYIGDPTNLLKTIGIGAIAHGIGKANEYSTMDDPKKRLGQLKSDWKKTLHLPENQKANSEKKAETQSPTIKNTNEQINSGSNESVVKSLSGEEIKENPQPIETEPSTDSDDLDFLEEINPLM